MQLLGFAFVLFGHVVSSFPTELLGAIADFESLGVPSTAAALTLSQQRTNCGPTPCGVFNAQDQFVSTTGKYAYASPAASQIRGPCPGLNAAANHGYISRSGVTTIAETVSGLGAAYGMSAELAGFLAAYAIIMDGQPLLGTWSIGGPPPADPLTSGLLGGAQGISYSHNVYEGDSSIARPDAYLNNGDAHSLDVSRFASAYATSLSDDRYTLDRFAQNFNTKGQQSIATNPNYFAAPFSTTFVTPAAYNFVINFMSNHSEVEVNGYLDGAMLKSFFAVAGDYPSFTWLKGQERIPNNWYRRPSTAQYSVPDAALDVAIEFAAYPNSFRLGGNVNGVNTYTGVDISDLTGGAYHSADLLSLNTSNATCFYSQFVQAVIPDAAATLLGELSAILDLVNKFIKPITGGLNCPQMEKYDQTLFNKYPGYKYRPKGQATNYKV